MICANGFTVTCMFVVSNVQNCKMSLSKKAEFSAYEYFKTGNTILLNLQTAAGFVAASAAVYLQSFFLYPFDLYGHKTRPEFRTCVC